MGIRVSGHKEAASRLAVGWGSKVTPGFEGSDSLPWAPVGTKYTQLGLYSHAYSPQAMLAAVCVSPVCPAVWLS